MERRASAKQGIFCLSAYVRRSIQRNKSLPAVAVSRPIPNKIPISKQMKSGVVFCNSCHSFFFCIAHKHHHIKSSPAWYALQVGGRETDRRLSGNRFFHSQIKHWASWQISTLMRFFERPGGFVEIIIPQIVQKEKPAGKRSSAGSLYTFLRSVCTLLRTV